MLSNEAQISRKTGGHDSGSCCEFLARGACPTSGKCGAIRASTRRLNVPNSGREIRGGELPVNAIWPIRLRLHALVKRRADSAIAKGGRFGECPRRPRTASFVSDNTRRSSARRRVGAYGPPPPG